ncbi:hypothetical protein M9458_029862, partial [Cirrhinus mrigala]
LLCPFGLSLAYLFVYITPLLDSTCPSQLTMWASRIYLWTAIAWTLLSLFHRPVTGLLQYSATELLWLRGHLSVAPLAVLLLHPDIALLPRQRYTHRGSRRNYHFDNPNGIKSFWSTTRHPLRGTDQSVDHSVLASLARLDNTNTSCKHNIAVNFGLLNIRSLTSKEHLIQDLLIG